ncbi:murein biosynthesis integral membrane protein MurJ [Methylotetracoccus oryzae]|uniref:murein biosynthesis integral membrane protein MurJ n=1 Tax=Methylotetracoccus oryzae TaxID=1919059 RepID=UPI0011194A1A|nr:murein biosynthesis integral membrane protein MurJ [Methylotetracoccus oryzae]
MTKAILKSTAVVALLTLVSRILGFIRDAVIAAFFGADAATDAFFIAFRIPNFLRRLFSEGSFSQAFVPVLTRYKDTGSPTALKLFLDHTAGALATLALGITAAGIVAAPALVLLFAPGFLRDAPLFSLSTETVRITLPYLGLITMAAFGAAILNTFGHFAIPAITPAILNLTMITAAIAVATHVEQPIHALAWSVTIAGLLQLLFQVPALSRAGLLPRPRWGFGDPEVVRMLKQIGPTVLSTSVTQINVLLNTLIGSFLVSGSVSWLYYSDRLVEFPVGLLGVAIGTVMLPQLSQSHAAANAHAFSASLDWALRIVLLVAVPATIGLVLCAKPLLFSLFQYDQFSLHDVEMTSRSLATYSLGITGFIAARVLLSGFTARHDYRTPFRFGVIAIGVNLLASAALAYAAAPLGWGHAALGLGTSLAGLLNSALLLRELVRLEIYRPPAGWGRLMLQTLAACTVMGVLLTVLNPEPTEWRDWRAMERLTHLGLLVAGGMIAYASCLWGLGLRPRHLQFHPTV